MTAQIEMISKEVGMAYSVCLIEDLKGFPIGSLVTEIGNNWQSGAASENFAILMLIAKNDEEVFVATSKKLRFSLPDSIVQTVVDEHVIPELKRGNYYSSVSTGIDRLQFKIEQYWFSSDDKDNSNSTKLTTALAFIFIISIAIFIIYDWYKLGRMNPKFYEQQGYLERRSGLLKGPDKHGKYLNDYRAISTGFRNQLPW